MGDFKPLPEHTKLDYYECCALLILSELFPERYTELILSDKPDIQGVDVGIEVTMADERWRQEALNNWVKAYNCDDEGLKQRCIGRMKQLGVEYTGGIQVWPSYHPTFDQSRIAIENKIKKIIKGNYKNFSRYELFIFTETWYEEDVLKNACEYIYSSAVREVFKTIYVLSEGCELHVFETEDRKHKFICIDSVEQGKRFWRARRMVEEAEGL